MAGNLEGFGDVDWYEFQLSSYDFTETGTVDVIFDIDYADGLGRPNTAISVYREGGQGFGVDAPQLIYYGESSNLVGDQTMLSSELSGGSYGVNDPYIGPVSIDFDFDFGTTTFGGFGGFNTNTSYYVAVSPIGLVPSVIADGSAIRTPVTGIEDDFNRGWTVQADLPLISSMR